MIITSETSIPQEEHFKVIAGPGAGKTTFLVKHIERIHKSSEVLSSLRKIACITHTNSGVQSIIEKLGIECNLVEISTIHSFLYRHILKPYGSFLTGDYNLNMSNVTGHDEHFVERSKVENWLRNHTRAKELKNPFSVQQLLKLRYDQLAKWLGSLRYEMDEFGEISLIAESKKSLGLGVNDRLYTLEEECVKILEADAINYKKLYWAEGKIDHDDVLFLSLKLVSKYPFILRALHARFPYFLIDEFQDSHPIQVELIKRLGEAKTKVGIIGDTAQSIYVFQGAVPDQLTRFSLPNIKNYTIEDNHRSTKEIVDVLNYVRKDIQQESKVGEGTKPMILVGDRHLAYEMAKGFSQNEDIKVLYRKNNEALAMRKQVDYATVDSDLLDELMRKDANSKRRKAIITCLEAIELAKTKQFNKAIRKMRSVTNERDPSAHQGKALSILNSLLSCYDSYQREPLLTFFDFLQLKITPSLPKLRTGAGPYEFYSKVSYSALAVCIGEGDYKGNHITIHQAKGAGFENVLLILEKEKHLDFLLNPDLSDEEHRIYYVALSRAKRGLFINVPNLSEQNRNTLGKMFIVHENVGSNTVVAANRELS